MGEQFHLSRPQQKMNWYYVSHAPQNKQLTRTLPSYMPSTGTCGLS
jgi:hypothetical protein